MAHGLAWQNWLTLSPGPDFRVTQSAHDYADLTGLHDLAAFIEVSLFVGPRSIFEFQVSPTADEALFVYAGHVDVSVGVSTIRFGLHAGTVWARYLRWRIAAEGDWRVCFRIALAGYASRRASAILRNLRGYDSVGLHKLRNGSEEGRGIATPRFASMQVLQELKEG